MLSTPPSAYMKLIRESLAFAGAGRAALLQLAHPYVAAGVNAHSSIGADGSGVQTRFYRTFFYMFRLAFGEKDVVERAARAVRMPLSRTVQSAWLMTSDALRYADYMIACTE